MIAEREPIRKDLNVEEAPLLALRGLTVRFGEGCPVCRGGVALDKNRCPVCRTVWALRDVSLELYAGEVLGIVGESGSGKSTLMKCMYFDQTPTEGTCSLAGEPGYGDLFALSRQQQRHVRNHDLGMVYQNPLLGLRMNHSSAGNVAEKLIAAGHRHVGRMNERVNDLLTHVQIQTARRREPPRNFSGGMQQRVQISRALANNPRVLLLDEVTTGLDLSVQARVLDLIRDIRREFGVSMLLVSHDLSVVRMLADRCLVMLDGRVVEQGLTDRVLDDPQHPYTQELVHSML